VSAAEELPEGTATDWRRAFRPPRLVPLGDGWTNIVADERVPRPRRPVPPAPPGTTRWLSVSDLQARWSCGRTQVYSAIAEMQAAGYLRRLQLGRVQRVAEESVERFEAIHAGPRGEVARAPARRREPARDATPIGAAIRALKVA
jgi:hypothetical protein